MKLDYGKMNEREKEATNTIAMNTIGIHFSPSVSRYLVELIRCHTWPLDETCCPLFVQTGRVHNEFCHKFQ